MFKFELGQEVKEKVTGYAGVVMSRSEYFTGCLHYGIQSRSLTPDGKTKDWEYFDESRLELIGNEFVLQVPDESTSGPGRNPPQMG
jgi:hypothetical protein